MSDPRPNVIVVDDDAIVAESIVAFLRTVRCEAQSRTSAEDGLAAIEEAELDVRAGREGVGPFTVLVVDMALPGMSGLELIKTLRQQQSPIVPVVITGYGTIEQAVSAIRHGAIDYLTKPLVDEELRVAIEKAFNQHMLLAENQTLRRQLDERDGLDSIVGSDRRMRRIYELIEAVAPSKTTVLMSGESGTGKSLIARAIHNRSQRAGKPYVEISCGSIPETLLESELFGHVKGAFTGAHTDKAGRFQAAEGGTLFLDEINAASAGMQLKLLRVLQERAFERVGSNETVEVDVRVVLASNQPLEHLVASGEFRQDLYYRINVVLIELPPLRDRLSDIPSLITHFLGRKAGEANKQITGLTDEAHTALQSYSYPGNVRELENIIERAVVLTRSTRIELHDLPPQVQDNSADHLLPRAAGDRRPASEFRPMPLRKALEEPEKQIILAALEANNWNRQQTAEALDINRTTLYKKIKSYGLEEYGEAG